MLVKGGCANGGCRYHGCFTEGSQGPRAPRGHPIASQSFHRAHGQRPRIQKLSPRCPRGPMAGAMGRRIFWCELGRAGERNVGAPELARTTLALHGLAPMGPHGPWEFGCGVPGRCSWGWGVGGGGIPGSSGVPWEAPGRTSFPRLTHPRGVPNRVYEPPHIEGVFMGGFMHPIFHPIFLKGKT